MSNVISTKGAVFIGDKLLTYLRDNKPDLVYPNMWDFPGGGMEGDETPIECFIRETKEEFGITLTPEDIIWEKTHPSKTFPDKSRIFFVARLPENTEQHIVFGDEGQRWELVTVEDFLSRTTAMESLQNKLLEYLHEARTVI